MKTRVTMTEDQLWHLFVTMAGICAAGSENENDEEVTIMLARAIHARGITSYAIEKWLRGNRVSGHHVDEHDPRPGSYEIVFRRLD